MDRIDGVPLDVWGELYDLLHPDGFGCPKCGLFLDEEPYPCVLEKARKYQCLRCRHMFSFTSGTPFHRSHLPLMKIWTASVIMKLEPGITGHDLKDAVGVPYKTAYSLKRRLLPLIAKGPTP